MELTALVSSIAFLFRLRQPLLKFLKRNDATVAFLFFFSGFFAPSVELLVGDAPCLDPCETLLVFLAISLEYRIVGLLFCPLL